MKENRKKKKQIVLSEDRIQAYCSFAFAAVIAVASVYGLIKGYSAYTAVGAVCVLYSILKGKQSLQFAKMAEASSAAKEEHPEVPSDEG